MLGLEDPFTPNSFRTLWQFDKILDFIMFYRFQFIFYGINPFMACENEIEFLLIPISKPDSYK